MLAKKTVVMADLGTGMGRELLPLSLGSVTSYAASLPEVSGAYDFHVHYLDRDFATALLQWPRPAVLAVAFYGWNKQASLRLVQAAKAMYPDCRVVLGGPSVPGRPDSIDVFMRQHPEVDFLVHGEGEVTFAHLLQTLDAGSDLRDVQGITFRDAKSAAGHVTNPARPRLNDLNVIPSPYLNGFFDDILRRYGRRVTGALFETNRGCPFSCTFCDWGAATMGKVRAFALDRVLAEFDWMSKNRIFYAYGADANFGILYERDLKIADHVGRLHKQTGFPGYFRICWTKNSSEKITEITDRLRRNGVDTMVTLSMQSFNEATLGAVKRKNIRHDDLLRLKKNFHARGIQTYTEIILGLPEETYQSFHDGLTEMMTTRLQDLACIYPCTMIENAEMSSTESRERYRIETRTCHASNLRTATARNALAQRDSARDADAEHRFAGLTQDDAAEVDEIVVGTSTLPVADWRKSFIYGQLIWALFFYRTAFFVMHYLHQEFGGRLTDFVDFLLEEVEADRSAFPRVGAALHHLERQADSILSNGATTLPLPGYGERAFMPAEAAVTIILEDAESFYEELLRSAELFCQRRGVSFRQDVLWEVVVYQKALMPHLPAPKERVLTFEYNVPQFFQALTSQRELPAIRRAPHVLRVKPLQCVDGDRQRFAIDRVEKGITLKMNSASPEAVLLEQTESVVA